MKEMLVGAMTCAIVLLWVLHFIVLFRLESLAKRLLYILATGSDKGYSWRKFIKNVEVFAIPPNEKLAHKVKALDRIQIWIVCTALILASLAILVKELG